jgi:hypothetical protein
MHFALTCPQSQAPAAAFLFSVFGLFFFEMLLKSYTLYSNETTFLYLLRGVF